MLGEVMLAVAVCQRKADTARELAQLNAVFDWAPPLHPAGAPTHAQLTAAAEPLRARRELLRVRGHIAYPRCLPSLAFICCFICHI